MKKFKLQNLDCPSCASKIEEGIQKLDCVQFVSINFATLSMNIATSCIEKVRAEIEKIEPGIKLIEIIKDKTCQIEDKFNIKSEIIFIIIIAVVYINGLIFQKQLKNTPFQIVEYVLFLSIYIITGWKVLFKAFKNILKGKIFDENFLMTVATLGAIAIKALSEAAGVMLFFKVGEFFQGFSINRSRKSIKSLLEIRPDYANLKTDGKIKRVSPEEVKIGDLVIVKPGEKIPLDGIIISGNTYVDTTLLTGESVPRMIKEKDNVLAGMINKSGLITIEVTKIFGETSISKILDLVENATCKKAKTEQFFTTFAKYYTPIVVGFALLTAILPPLILSGQNFFDWIYRALVILVITCPCALVVSIPLAYFGGIGRASKRGILIKGSNYLEILNSIKTVVFDKTGTITKGIFKVTEVVPQNGFTDKELLRLSAEAEAHSNHPIAVSIRESYGKNINSSVIKDYQEIGGQGVKAIVENRKVIAGNDRMLHDFNIDHNVCCIQGTVVHIAVDNKYAGYIVISDEIKNDSKEAIRQLKDLGVKRTVMLTGDNDDIAEDVSKKINIDKYYAGLMPEDKVSILESLIDKEKNNEKIVFIGDGVNDAPSLARADLGISMGNTGADAAIEIADIVIMNDSLLKIPEAIRIAKKTRVILFQNIFFALAIKGIFITLGFLGLATMWEAVFGDMGVTLLAILNSSRLLKIK